MASKTRKKQDSTDWAAVDALTDNQINLAVANDPETAPLDAKGLTLVKRGRPRKANPKRQITIRLSPDVLDSFRSMGNGWQTKIDEALKDWLKRHRAA